MTRALGVFVVLLVMATPAAAEKAAKKPAATKQAEPAPPAEDAPLAGSGAEGSDADKPLSPEEIEATLPPHINGPKLVDLGHDIEIDLPAGMLLLERAEARKMLEKGGDYTENVLAVVGKLDANWLVVIEYDDVGYVNDSDADQLNAKELFQQYQDGTKEQNARRKTLGVAELFLDGWSEMPAYQRPIHQLVWGLKAHSTEGPVINFFTRILGRNGYLSVNLIDSPDAIEKSKVEAGGALTGLRFKHGARYEDHSNGDKDSGLGLKALVLGGAGIAVAKAAKAGILIKLLLVFKKGFILVFAAIGGFFKWLFGRKKQDAVPPSDPPPSEPPPTATEPGA